jgi:hypothetical protein
LADGFSFREVADATKLLKNGKASGCDYLLSEHVKYGGEILVKWF